MCGDSFLDDLNPADGTLIARVSEAGPEIVDAAVKAARRAFRGEWRTAGVRQRAALLYKIAEGIEARFDELVQAESADTGNLSRLLRGLMFLVLQPTFGFSPT